MLLVKVDGKVFISRILHGGLIHRQGKFIIDKASILYNERVNQGRVIVNTLLDYHNSNIGIHDHKYHLIG